jgi:hypothetical protein
MLEQRHLDATVVRTIQLDAVLAGEALRQGVRAWRRSAIRSALARAEGLKRRSAPSMASRSRASSACSQDWPGWWWSTMKS